MTDAQKLDDLLTRGVGEFIDPDGIFRKKLEAKMKGEYKKDIIIKFGIDPTRPDIHIGHAVVLHKLRKFQDLGCKVIFLIGDYTGQIGDPTGKNKIRPEIRLAEILANAHTYVTQVGEILKKDEDVFSWIKNSDWFTDVSDVLPGPDSVTNLEITEGNTKKTISIPPNSFLGKAILLNESRMQKMDLHKPEIHTVSLSGVLRTLRHLTHSRLIARDMFKERLAKGEELYMHEMLYPVLQGLDSHILAKVYGSCDLEIGGTDQTFNMLVGRDVMKMYQQPEQAVLALKILEGTDGKEKMSKSLDNYISITDEPNDMYGKVMSIPDSSIANYFELCTFTPLVEVENIKKQLAKDSVNPKDLKMDLARQIVSIYHGEAKAQEAEESFINTFQKKETPKSVPEVPGSVGTPVSEVLVKSGILSSKSEWRRLVSSKSVHDLSDNTQVTDVDLKVSEGLTLKIGKMKFVKIRTN